MKNAGKEKGKHSKQGLQKMSLMKRELFGKYCMCGVLKWERCENEVGCEVGEVRKREGSGNERGL